MAPDGPGGRGLRFGVQSQMLWDTGWRGMKAGLGSLGTAGQGPGLCLLICVLRTCLTAGNEAGVVPSVSTGLCLSWVGEVWACINMVCSVPENSLW